MQLNSLLLVCRRSRICLHEGQVYFAYFVTQLIIIIVVVVSLIYFFLFIFYLFIN